MPDVPQPEIDTAPATRTAVSAPPDGRFFIRGVALMLMASALLGLCGEVEKRWLDSVPWSRAAVLVDGMEPCDQASGRIPVRVLRLPPESLESVLSPAETALFHRPEWAETTDLSSTGFGPPWLILLDADASVLAPLIASGHAPDPDLPEVLAGELIAPTCHTVDIHGVSCTVSGRLRGGIPAFPWAFVALNGNGMTPILRDCPEVWSGCLDPEGLNRMAENFDESSAEARPVAESGAEISDDADTTSKVVLRSWDGSMDAGTAVGEVAKSPGTGSSDNRPDQEDAPFWIANPCRTRPEITFAGLAALFLSFLGGALLQRDLLYRMAAAARPDDFFYPFLREIRRFTRLWKWLHGVYYSWVLVCMLAALAMPALGLFLLSAVQQVFSEGSLAYVGAAYESGSVLQAAWATFYNNYIIQTVRNTILLSIFGLPVGVFIVFSTLFPTAMVMSPICTRVVSGYALHSVTMTLELQAYLLAVFAVLCWSRRVWIFLARPTRFTFAGLTFGVRALAGATLFIGIQLAVAALYEAITLLLFMS